MERTLIAINVPNAVSIVLMAALGYVAVLLLKQLVGGSLLASQGSMGTY